MSALKPDFSYPAIITMEQWLDRRVEQRLEEEVKTGEAWNNQDGLTYLFPKDYKTMLDYEAAQKQVASSPGGSSTAGETKKSTRRPMNPVGPSFRVYKDLKQRRLFLAAQRKKTYRDFARVKDETSHPEPGGRDETAPIYTAQAPSFPFCLFLPNQDLPENSPRDENSPGATTVKCRKRAPSQYRMGRSAEDELIRGLWPHPTRSGSSATSFAQDPASQIDFGNLRLTDESSKHADV